MGKKKASSGRKLSSKMTEGECGIIKSVLVYYNAGSFHR